MASFSGKIPTFNGSNYATWRTQMEALLSRLLKIVDGTTVMPAEPREQELWMEKDQDARADILLAIDAKILNLVKGMKISKEIWDFLEETSARQKVEVYRKILNFKMNRNHTIVSYLEEKLGGKIEEELAVIILLDGLSDDFKETKAAFNIAN